MNRWTDEKTGFRIYEIDGIEYPFFSVTTVLDCLVPARLKNWFINNTKKDIEHTRTVTADAGSRLHALIDKYYKKETIQIDDDLKRMFDVFVDWAEKNPINVIESEAIVYSREHGYAGQFDMICDNNGVVEILDWKTGMVKTTHGWQLAAYKLAWEEMHGKKIEGMRVVQPRIRDNKITEFKYQHLDFCEDAFLHALQTWKALNYNILAKPFMRQDGSEFAVWPFLNKDSFKEAR